MSIENGDFVRVNFTGKIIETDEVFDTTYEEIAQEADIYVENKEYVPIPIVENETTIPKNFSELFINIIRTPVPMNPPINMAIPSMEIYSIATKRYSIFLLIPNVRNTPKFFARHFK